MDSWDPVVVDGFAQARPVILFDNQGVSRSSGKHGETFVDEGIRFLHE
jgi:hypothetical protein